MTDFQTFFQSQTLKQKAGKKTNPETEKLEEGSFPLLNIPQLQPDDPRIKQVSFLTVFFELSNLDLIEKVYKFFRLPFWFLVCQLSNVIYTPLVAE